MAASLVCSLLGSAASAAPAWPENLRVAPALACVVQVMAD